VVIIVTTIVFFLGIYATFVYVQITQLTVFFGAGSADPGNYFENCWKKSIY
jgi:hypothetical protein